mgnify:CR=1 FL=1
MVTIDYEDQIPIFFYDYTFPRSIYGLRPGETNNILSSAVKIVTGDPKVESLIVQRGLGGLFKK